MRRKSVVFGVGIVLLVGGTAGIVAGLLLHEPDFYRHCAVAQGRERQVESGQFLSDFVGLVKQIHNEAPRWEVSFKEECINSYFEESFVPSGVAQRLLPEGVSEPRITIQEDKVRLGFRYHSGLWNTVVSVDLGVWLAAKERNVVALELQGLHAGSLPITAQSLQERVTQVARSQGIEVTWWRHNGNPVALFRFQADRPRPTVQLQQLELHQGWLYISGSSSEPALGALFPALRPQAE